MNDLHTSLLSPAVLMRPERFVFPYGWVGHIPFAFWLVSVLQPRTLVELGTHSGNSYCAFCQGISTAGAPTRAWAVDSWEGDEHAGEYDDAVYKELQAYHDGRYSGFSRLLRMLFDDAVREFDDGSVELLHIDGLHTYEAVKHDFETWLPKVCRRRGVVLFHDTQVREGDFGVHRLWDEVLQRHPGFNFEHSHGLGVLLVGDELPGALAALAQSPAAWALARDYFAALGAGLEGRATAALQEARLRDLQEVVGDREKRLGYVNDLLADRERYITDRERHIANLDQLLQHNDAQMRELQADLERRAVALERLQASSDAHVEELKGEIRRQLAKVEELTARNPARAASAPEKQPAAREAPEALQARVRELESELARRNAQWSNLVEAITHSVEVSDILPGRR